MATSSQATSSDDYFTSYGDLGVHELMLNDRPRTTFYRKFFETHQEFVKGKVVMDVGAGTGILSLFAATAGAKTVYAVEASPVASLCEEIVQENGFESVIKVIHSAVEDVTLPGDIRVDIIVSEWMGFYLLHESMLDSVLVARDKFLAPGGILVPSRACLYMAPVDMTEHFQNRADYWSNMYGYDFSPIASTFNIQEVSKPLVKTLNSSVVKADAEKLLDLDLGSMSVEDVKSFSKTCKFSMTEESRIHGFVTWFDVSFEGLACDNSTTTPSSTTTTTNGVGSESTTKRHFQSNNDDSSSFDKNEASHISDIDSSGDAKLTNKDNSNCVDSNSVKTDGQNFSSNSEKLFIPSSTTKNTSSSSSVVLSTSPFSPATHWKQTVVFLPQTIMVIEDILLCCQVRMSQDSSNNKRHYNISLELKDEMDLDDNDDDEEVDSDDSSDHPVPCECGSNRCSLIAALVDKYDTEHQELGEEAHMVEMEAEVEAAKAIDTAVETEGWSLDMSGTDTAGGDNHN